ncbi:hypothetical protein D3C76_1781920 [compost metagenome]
MVLGGLKDTELSFSFRKCGTDSEAQGEGVCQKSLQRRYTVTTKRLTVIRSLPFLQPICDPLMETVLKLI